MIETLYTTKFGENIVRWRNNGGIREGLMVNRATGETFWLALEYRDHMLQVEENRCEIKGDWVRVDSRLDLPAYRVEVIPNFTGEGLGALGWLALLVGVVLLVAIVMGLVL